MRLGFANIFSFRPHVEHLIYLSKLLDDAGHEVFFLTCDSSVENCYARQLKGSSRVFECSKCILGGVRSFTSQRITSVSPGTSDLSVSRLNEMCLSSSCTLTRTESEHEWDDMHVVNIRESLITPVSSTYHSTKAWISKNKLEGVICFNGRMDLTRGVIEACRDLGVPFLTHERTWFGDGIQLTPNGNCLALDPLCRVVDEFSSKPLTEHQASIAGRLIGERFLQKNSLEWRLYNKNPEPAPWPIDSQEGLRILIIPSSKNEFAGHDDWKSSWASNTDALDDFFDCFSIAPSNAVVRCHPNWSENIGKVSGERSLLHYKKWSSLRGVHFISSESKLSTYDLIQQADVVIVNGGSSAVEAGACGKKVICLGPSTYQNAGFVQTFNSRRDMEAFGMIVQYSEEIRRKTLRFVYTRSHRHPQYVKYVKAIETTTYKYFEGADPNRLLKMLETGIIEADDDTFSDSDTSEELVLSMLSKADWAGLSRLDGVKSSSVSSTNGVILIQRLPWLRWVDSFRSLFARGDK